MHVPLHDVKDGDAEIGSVKKRRQAQSDALTYKNNEAFALFRILSNWDTLKTSFRNNANVRTRSANFLHILDEVGVQARTTQYNLKRKFALLLY